MEKSMIENLGRFSQLESFSPRSTFTTTIKECNTPEMKKSRINNLPGHTKSDMSVRLPFVLIFQTMEIERLSLQIQSLRVALKDSQRQVFNCESYEIQIKELTQQYENYDRERSSMRDQIQRLKISLQDSQEEVQELKRRYTNVDSDIMEKYDRKVKELEELSNENMILKGLVSDVSQRKDREFNDLRQNMRTENETLLQSRVKGMNTKYENEKVYLENKLRKLQELMQEKDSEISRLTYDNESMQMQLQPYKEIQKHKRQLEDKMYKITEDNIKLNEINRKFKQQNIKLNQDRDYFIVQLRELQDQKMKLQNENTKIPEYINQFQDIKIKYNNLYQDSRNKEEKLAKIPILEETLQSKYFEIQNLNSILKEKGRQAQDFDKKLKKSLINLQQLKREEEKIPKLQRKVSQMHYEKQRVSTLLMGKNKENEEVIRRYRELENQYQEECRKGKMVENRVRQLEQQNGKLNREYEQVKNFYSQLNSQFTQLKNYNNQLNSEHVSLKNEHTELTNNNLQLHNTHKQLTNEYNKLVEESQNLKNKNSQIQQQLQTIQETLQEKTQQLNRIKEYIDKLEEQLNVLKEVQDKLIVSLQEREKLMKQVQKTKNEKDQLEENLYKTENSLRTTQNQLYSQKQECQLVKNILNGKVKQLQNANETIKNMHEQIQTLRETQRQYYYIKNQYEELLPKYHDLQVQLKDEKQAKMQLSYEKDKLQNDMQKIKKNGYFPLPFKTVFEDIKKEVQRKNGQIFKQNQRIKILNNNILQLRAKLIDKKEKIAQNNDKWFTLMAQIIKEMEEVKQIGGLREEILTLMEENLKLQGTMIETENRRASVLSSSNSSLSRKTFQPFTPLENYSYVTKSKLSTKDPLSFKSSQVTNFR